MAQQKFPAWMDEVSPDNKASVKVGFNEPAAPIDPSTGQPSATPRPPGSAFHKPNLPDFSKMREKAIKAELEKRLAADGELENSYSASISNLDQLKEKKTNLETLLGANPSDNERNLLLSGLGELSKKLALSEEFIKLLGQDTGQAGQRTPVASLSSTQFNRAIEIQKLLFPGSSKKRALTNLPPNKSAKGKSGVEPETGEDYDREPTEEELIKARTYRPGGVKSFYLESKKAKQQQQEAEEE